MLEEYMIVVEDRPIVCENIVIYLRSRFPKFRIEGAYTYNDAIKLLHSARPRDLLIKVVIVDEVLTKPNDLKHRGSVLLKHVKRYYPWVRKIMLAAQANTFDLSRALNEGDLDRYILKNQYDRNKAILEKTVKDVLSLDRGPIYEAITESLSQLDNSDVEDVIFVGGKKLTPKELLLEIINETQVGRGHTKDISRLLFDLHKDPNEFLNKVKQRGKEVKKSGKHRRKSTKK